MQNICKAKTPWAKSKTNQENLSGSGQILLTHTDFLPMEKERGEERRGKKDTKGIHVVIQMANKNSKIFSMSLTSEVKWNIIFHLMVRILKCDNIQWCGNKKTGIVISAGRGLNCRTIWQQLLKLKMFIFFTHNSISRNSASGNIQKCTDFMTYIFIYGKIVLSSRNGKQTK